MAFKSALNHGRRRAMDSLLLATSALALSAGAALAGPLPTGGAVASGTASITSPLATQLTVNQTSAKAILTWNTFSIGAGNTVQFNNGSGATLNRVTGTGASQIDGALLATGSVYLVNPNGVVIGKTGVVNTGGTFVASSLDISNSAFLAGGALSFSGTSAASVVNLGQIGSSGGDVVLAAQTVENDGAITAPAGDVGLLAGSQVTLSDTLTSNGKFSVALGSSSSATNSGQITAALAELRAYGGNVYALAGNSGGGAITVAGVATHDGQIVLDDENGTSQVAGVLDAKGVGGAAGQITTLGPAVQIGAATVDAHDGTWLIYTDSLTIDQSAAATISHTLNLGSNITTQLDYNASSHASTGLVVAAPISWNTAVTLELFGPSINAPITVAGPGELDLETGNSTGDITSYSIAPGGAINFTSPPNVHANLVINGVSFTLIYSLTDLTNVTSDGYYALANDLDASGATYANALIVNHGYDGPVWYGALDGLGHVITGLTINAPSTDNVGLISMLGGQVAHLGLINATINGHDNVGALVGDNAGNSVTGPAMLYQTYSTGTVSGSDNVGGLIGYSPAAVITSSYSNSSVSGSTNVGGLVGQLSAEGYPTDDVYATGAVTGVTNVGGLVGESEAVISNAYATGRVAGSTGVGGLVGTMAQDPYSGSRIQNTYATGAVSGDNEVGGLVGLAASGFSPSPDNGSVSDSYATGAVTAPAGASGVGGLVGIGGEIGGSYATGAVSGGLSYVGGLAGSATTIAGSYATGAVAAASGANFVGGLAGEVGQVSSSYATGAVMGADYVGGLAGRIFATPAPGQLNESPASGGVTGSYATGTVTGTGASRYVGGLLGYNDTGDQVVQSYATGAVRGVTDVGGLVGYNAPDVYTEKSNTLTSAVVTESHATGAVVGTDQVGGLVGENDGRISNSYAAGAVSGVTDVGGLVGYTAPDVSYPGYPVFYSLISNAYATGVISGADHVGGLVGENDGDINGAYATGAVTGTSAVGGLTGSNLGAVTNGYWDTQASGLATSASGVGLTTAQFADASTFTGFSFTTTPGGAGWVIVDQDGSLNNAGGAAGATRPILASEYSTSLSNGHQLQLMAMTLGASYTLANDISLAEINNPSGVWITAEGFAPIGNAGANFTGSLEGDGFVIDGLKINSSALALTATGLFGVTGASSSIDDVGLTNISVTGPVNYNIGQRIYLAGLVGDNAGAITKAYATGDLHVSGFYASAEDDIGLLAGANSGVVIDSRSGGSISDSTESGGAIAGGLVGLNSGVVSQSHSAASVTVSFDPMSGGLVGSNALSGTITSSYATGPALGGHYSGGLVGGNDGRIIQSYASGLTGLSLVDGGLVGLNDGTISASYAIGTVVSIFEGGGLVGDNAGTVTEVYASGSVVGSGGGLVGSNTGAVTAGYWDTGTTGQSTSAGGVGLTTAQFASASNFTGFSFTTTPGGAGWVIVDQDGGLNNAGGAAGATRPLLASEYSTTISNGHQLQLMAMAVAASYTLAGDVSLAAISNPSEVWITAEGFSPIGGSADWFTGSLNGAGHSIDSLTVNGAAAGLEHAGLFGVVGPLAVISDVSLTDAAVTGTTNVGVLAGRVVSASVDDVSASGSVTGTTSVGGLIGYDNAAAVSGSSASVTVSAAHQAGGLIGWNSGALSGDSATGSVTASGAGIIAVGGLVGVDYGAIDQSWASGAVSGGSGLIIGGLVGDDAGAVTLSYATGAVSGYGDVGGLAGRVRGASLSDDYATGAVTGNGAGAYDLGGFAGVTDAASSLTRIYATGHVTGSVFTGGLVGYNGGALTDAYWNVQTSGLYNAVGGVPGAIDATGLYTAQMGHQASYAGWNFATVWNAPAGGAPPTLR